MSNWGETLIFCGLKPGKLVVCPESDKRGIISGAKLEGKASLSLILLPGFAAPTVAIAEKLYG